MARTVYNNTLAVKALAPTAISTDTTTNGTAIDTAVFGNNFRDVLFVVNSATLTDGSYAVTVQESDASGSGYVAATNVLGTLPTFALTDDNTVKSFGVRPIKRYVRVVITSSATTSGGTLSAVAVLGLGGNNPVARS